MEIGKGAELVFQNLENKPRVKLGIIDVTGLKLSILIVFHEVVVRVSRKR